MTTMNLTLHVTLLDLLVNERQGSKPHRPQATQAHLPNMEQLKGLFRPHHLALPSPRPKRVHTLTELLPPEFPPLIRNFHFPALLHNTPHVPLQNELYPHQLKHLRRRR